MQCVVMSFFLEISLTETYFLGVKDFITEISNRSRKSARGTFLTLNLVVPNSALETYSAPSLISHNASYHYFLPSH